MEKFTIKQFRERFPNDNACLAELFKIRYGHMKECPKCEHKAEYVRVKTRKCYHCRYCYHQIYPTAGTIFHKSTTPLKDWFFVMFLMTSTRNGVASKEVERLLGCTYKTALRMTHQIRKLMSGKDKDKLTGFVEMDESWVGGTPRTSDYGSKWEKYPYRWRDFNRKSTVFGMVERRGHVWAVVVPDAKKETLVPIITKSVDKSAKVSTDENKAYKRLCDLGYEHKAVSHMIKQYRDGWATTNTIEGFWSQLKRMVKGTHIFVSREYLQRYIDECAYRYNQRELGREMFNHLLLRVAG